MNKQSSKHEIYLDEHGIVHIKVKEGAHVDEKTLVIIKQNIQELTGRRKVLAMVHAPSFHTFTPEGTSYLKKDIIDKTRIATAVVCTQVATRFMVDGMTKFQKAKSPVRMFSSEAQARTWLISQKKAEN